MLQFFQISDPAEEKLRGGRWTKESEVQIPWENIAPLAIYTKMARSLRHKWRYFMRSSFGRNTRQRQLSDWGEKENLFVVGLAPSGMETRLNRCVLP